MPDSAWFTVCCAWPIESSRELKSLARLFSDCEVKKLVGLSAAELTFLPVARSCCVVARKDAVLCSERRFCRTPADRVISDIVRTLLVDGPAGRGCARSSGIEVRPHLTPRCNAR